MMRSWVVDAFETPIRLGTAPKPAPEAGEILIDVEATGLNFADLLMIKGTYQETPQPPFAPGLEVAGKVADIGADVSGFTLGQPVAAYTGRDGLSEYVSTDTSRCLPLPESMDMVSAAGFQIAYGTSHLALTRRARIAAGERLAVLGAAGGVGLTAVEIGKALGAHVIAVARGNARLETARRAGADILIDTDTTQDLRTALKAAGPFDVIFDAVGGEIADAALRATAPEARHILIGFASSDLPRLKPNHLLVKNVDVLGVNWGGYLKFAPEALRDSLAELTRWHGAGRIHPHISKTFSFDKADNALAYLESRQATGKIVVTQ